MKAIFEGFDHNLHGFWKCELSIPTNYHLVKKGNTHENDMCMILVPPFPESLGRKAKKGLVTSIKGKWEIIAKSNICNPIKNFRAIIRRGS